VSARQLRQVLAEIRRTGVALSDRQVQMDAVSVAAPVYGAGDAVVAAVSVVVRAGEAKPSALVPVVRAAARGISRALGMPVRP
jgi:DNA-binding IclR family transcriptional regulator